MLNNTWITPDVTIGLDLGDKAAYAFIMDAQRIWLGNQTIPMTQAAVERAFHEYPEARVVMEVGTHSPWVSRILADRGYEVIVANARRVQLIAKSYNKHDGADAELLCRQGLSDPALLSPIVHRGADAQRDLATIRTRDSLIRARTLLINSIRGQLKAAGLRAPRCSAAAFPGRISDLGDVYRGLQGALCAITGLTDQIVVLDEHIEAAAKRHPECALLRQVHGVGPLTALSFVLTVDDPTRFIRSRDVAAYFGLCPRRRQSGDSDPELPITKAGDESIRRLLVMSAQKTMQANSPDSDLKAFGLRLAARGGRAAKNRAVVAVARKLAVLLHALWITGEVYQPVGYAEHSAELASQHLGPRPPTELQLMRRAQRSATSPQSRRRGYRSRSGIVPGAQGRQGTASSSAGARP